jgi:transcriptional regulator of arginine metabolism
MSKLLRQKTILALLEQGPIASQEDLQRSLQKRGVKVGQATLSRDIRDLGLAKTAEGYTLPQGDGATGSSLPPVSRLVREFVVDVRRAQNLLVIKTTVGSAQPVCAALDDEEWPEAVGSVAGDDTILIVCLDKKAANRLAVRTQEMLA